MNIWIKLKWGFTLLEIIIILAIIWVLASSLYPSVISYIVRARDTTRITNLKEIRDSIESYFITRDQYPSTACGYDCVSVNADSFITSWQVTWSKTPLASFSIIASTYADSLEVGHLESELAPFIGNKSLPRDPRNNAIYPWIDNTSYAYSYGNVWNNSDTLGYDLMATLENPNNKATCKNSFARYGYINTALCDPLDPNGNAIQNATFAGTYHSQLYEVWNRKWKYIVNWSSGNTWTDGLCGTANEKVYTSLVFDYAPDVQCISGVSSNTAFPNEGQIISWICNSSDGWISSPACSARKIMVCPATYVPVCGANGVDYDNSCYAFNWWTTVASVGTCGGGQVGGLD